MQQWFILLVINTLRMLFLKTPNWSFFSVNCLCFKWLNIPLKDSNHNHCRLATATMVVIRCALICSILFINIISHASPQQVFIICCSENESQLWSSQHSNCQSLDSVLSEQLPNNSVLELTNGSCNLTHSLNFSQDPYQKSEKFLEHLQREVNGDNKKFHTFVRLLVDTGHSNLASRLSG